MNQRSGMDWAVPVAVFVLTVVGCEGVKTSDKDIQRVEVAEVQRMLADGKTPTVLLDVRPARRFEQNQLPDALHIALPDLRARDERLGLFQRIIVYGDSYRDPLSAAATKRLLVLGYKNIYDFRGGVEAWQDAGLEVVQKATPPTP